MATEDAPVVATLVSNAPTVRKAVRDAVAPGRVRARGCGPRSVPRTADAVVTTGALNAQTDRLAARLGTWRVYVLPEALDALVQFVETHGAPPVLVGADVASIDRLAKADLNVTAQQEVLL